MAAHEQFRPNNQQHEVASCSHQQPLSGEQKSPSQSPQRRIFPKKKKAHLRFAHLFLQTPTSETPALAPPASNEEVLPPQDIALEVAKWTKRRDIPLAILAWAAVVLFMLWLASHVIGTLLLLLISGLFAYALAPLVALLARSMSRVLAVIIVYVVVLTTICILLYVVASSALVQLSSFSHSVGNFVEPTHPGETTPLEHILRPLGITSAQMGAFRAQLFTQLGGLANQVVPLVTGMAGALLNSIIVIILSIYLLFHGARITTWLQEGIPRSQRGRIRFLLHTLQRVVGGYIRGQFIMSSLIGVLVGLGMFLFHVPYALLLGILAFLLEFIPVLGTLISGLICVLIALTNGWLNALLVLGYFVGVHIFEGDIVGPRIIGKAVGLSPMVALIALVAGLELFGIGGALFAAPMAGVLQALIVTLWSEWREAHPEQFLQMKQEVIQSVAEKSADHPVEPDPPEKLLSS